MIVNNCMFFMLDSQYFSFSFIKGMKIETCDCLQKEDADIFSLLFVSMSDYISRMLRFGVS